MKINILLASLVALTLSSFKLRDQRGICTPDPGNSYCPPTAKKVCAYKQDQGIKIYDNSCQACKDLEHQPVVINIQANVNIAKQFILKAQDHYHQFITLWEENQQFMNKCNKLIPIQSNK